MERSKVGFWILFLAAVAAIVLVASLLVKS